VLVEATGILNVTPEIAVLKLVLSVNPFTSADLNLPPTCAFAECLKAVHLMVTSPRV
jgi:hypothetical protein